MVDDYFHKDKNIMYISENIPGPSDRSHESNTLIKIFNSQLLHNCECQEQCVPNTCSCLAISGGANYNLIFRPQTNSEMYMLNTSKNLNSYPIIECNDLCKCSIHCGNRLVQNGPTKTLFVVASDNKLKGLCLYTTTLIPEGTFVCEYAGEVLTKSQALSRYQHNETFRKMNYIFCLNEHVDGETVQTHVDPSTFGNIGRYINHSCDPNCEIVPVRINSPIVKLAVFSIKDIKANTEITFDYGADNVNATVLKPDQVSRTNCLCNSARCRGFMPYNP